MWGVDQSELDTHADLSTIGGPQLTSGLICTILL